MGTASSCKTLVTYGTTWFHNLEECCLPHSILGKLWIIKFTWYLITVFVIILCKWGTKTYRQVKSYFENALQCSGQSYWPYLIWAWRICCTGSFWLVFCWFRILYQVILCPVWHAHMTNASRSFTAHSHKHNRYVTYSVFMVSRIWIFGNRLIDSFSNISL